MQTIKLSVAKIHFSRLIDQIATGVEKEIVISRKGEPVARIVPVREDASRRIGLAKGEFKVPEDIDAPGAEVAALFLGRR